MTVDRAKTSRRQGRPRPSRARSGSSPGPRLRAPISGIVAKRQATKGQQTLFTSLARGALFEIFDPASLVVNAQITQRDLPFVRVGPRRRDQERRLSWRHFRRIRRRRLPRDRRRVGHRPDPHRDQGLRDAQARPVRLRPDRARGEAEHARRPAESGALRARAPVRHEGRRRTATTSRVVARLLPRGPLGQGRRRGRRGGRAIARHRPHRARRPRPPARRRPGQDREAGAEAPRRRRIEAAPAPMAAERRGPARARTADESGVLPPDRHAARRGDDGRRRGLRVRARSPCRSSR